MRGRRLSLTGNVSSRRNSCGTTTSNTTTTTTTGSSSSSQAADEVLASTAGLDNWKTWAGRQHGTDEFEFMDLFRGIKRSFHNTFLAGPPPPGTTCPVCFCEPDSPQDWFVTSSCSHAVCIDCLQAYASNQIRDKEQSGPLKCPVCPQNLRRSDAIAALRGDKELIRLWDLKIRNQLLRALPAFRSCPHCSGGDGDNNNNNNNNSNNKKEENQRGAANGGGGFVTPECLAPHYQERRDIATRILYSFPLVRIALLTAWISMVTIISKTPSSSTMIDLLFMFVPIYTFVRAGRAAQGWVAQMARKAFFKPITVECPCCDKPFILPAESKVLQDEETSRWMGAHTRPCPSCSVPIHKDGGCNHMRCGHCHANFCWACMRLRTSCAAYACQNGAPYRNAIPLPGANANAAPTLGRDSVSAVIDSILDRQRPTLGWTDGLLVFYAVFIRHFGPLQPIIEYTMTLVSFLFTSGIITTFASLYISRQALGRLRVQINIQRDAALAARMQADAVAPTIIRTNNNNHHDNRHGGAGHANRHRGEENQNGNAPITASELLLGIDERNARQRQQNMRFMTEDEMIAEATRRSMLER